jgi:hypothetical protein
MGDENSVIGAVNTSPAIIVPATVRTVHRRGKSMSRRTGQNGTVEERNGAWRGRFLTDIPGQMERQKRSVILRIAEDQECNLLGQRKALHDGDAENSFER